MTFDKLLIYLNDNNYRYRVEPRLNGEYYVRVIHKNGYLRISAEGRSNYVRDTGICEDMNDVELINRLKEIKEKDEP